MGSHGKFAQGSRKGAIKRWEMLGGAGSGAGRVPKSKENPQKDEGTGERTENE